MANVENPFIAQLRTVCLAFPEASERETWDAPTFRVREKIFVKAGYDEQHCVAWVKARTGVQEMLVSADPIHFFVPPYMGSRGWVGINLHNDPDWGEAEALTALAAAALDRGQTRTARDFVERALLLAPDYSAALDVRAAMQSARSGGRTL